MLHAPSNGLLTTTNPLVPTHFPAPRKPRLWRLCDHIDPYLHHFSSQTNENGIILPSLRYQNLVAARNASASGTILGTNN